MRTVPGMTILNPADSNEAYLAVEAALKMDGPCYLRFGRFAVPTVTDGEGYEFEVGRGVVLAEGTDVTLVATGFMVHLALEAREMLAAEGISARVVNIHTVKPLDSDLIAKCARETGAIVTAEEHSVIGGLGGAVAECVAEVCPVPVLRVGVEDKYGRSGKVPELLELYGLTSKNIAAKAKAAVALKK
jgi:transketolase